MSENSAMLGLKPELLRFLWPGERAVVGMRACKQLHELLVLGEVYLVKSTSQHAPDQETLTEELRRFRQSRLRLRWCGQGVDRLSPAMLKSECTAALTELAVANTLLADGDGNMLAEVLRESTRLSRFSLNNAFGWVGDGRAQIGQTSRGEGTARALAASIGRCEALEYVSLSECRMSTAGVALVVAALRDCKALTHLDLSKTDVSAPTLAAVLGEWRLLTHLDLRHNHIGADGARVLEEALGQCTTLKHLNVGTTEIRSAGMEILAGAIGKLTALTHLQVPCNNIGKAGMGSLAAAVRSTALVLLDVFGNSMGEGGARALAEGLEQHSSLTHLNMGSSAIGPGAASVVAPCQSLVVLRLSRVGLADNSARQLASVLRGLAALEELNLSENAIGPHGARSVADALEECPRLTSLSLAKTAVGGEGAARLVAACPGLTDLNLHSVGLGDAGAGVLAEALRESNARGLTSLDVNNNAVAEDGARCLALALRELQCKELMLALWLDSVPPEARGEVEAAFKLAGAVPKLGWDYQWWVASVSASDNNQT